MIIKPEKIKKLRKRHGITQNQLADSLYHVKRNRIADWESGRRNIPPIIWWAMVMTWDKKDLTISKKTFDKLSQCDTLKEVEDRR